MNIPFFDLSRQYRSIKKEIKTEIAGVCDSGRYILGENVSALESEVAAYSGASFGVGVASGTDALFLSLMAAGVGRGDKVLTTPFTFVATVSVIEKLGAMPVFVDIDARTFNIDPNAVESYLKKSSKGVKAMVPVHLFGQCADMGPLLKIARKYGIKVIEDAAQAIGAGYGNKKAGAMGDFGCFSFYPTKNLGGMGDGGMVTTNSKRAAALLMKLRGYGASGRYLYDAIGVNSRLDEIQAAVLRVKLRYLDKWADERVKNASIYTGLIKKAGLEEAVSLPLIIPPCTSVYNQFVLRAGKRNALRSFLADDGIGTEVYYPLPMHLQKCFKYLGYKRGDFPCSEEAAKTVMALPIFQGLKRGELTYIVSSIKRFYKG
ncbi:MAG: DegT/DnrJ/EryC1/StrS family aminotransferase [Thermodesulfobacteriota bacterium]